MKYSEMMTIIAKYEQGLAELLGADSIEIVPNWSEAKLMELLDNENKQDCARDFSDLRKEGRHS